MKLRFRADGPTLTFSKARTLRRNFADARRLPEKTSTISLDRAGPIHRWRTDILFAYEIFPARIMRFDAEWIAAGRPMAVGDIILQRAALPPFFLRLSAEFTVRISAIVDEPTRVGFAYETLEGHAERGVSEFAVEEKPDGLWFTIHTFSEPAHWSARLAKPFFTLPFQAWCTRQALAHVRVRFQTANPPAPAAELSR